MALRILHFRVRAILRVCYIRVTPLDPASVDALGDTHTQRETPEGTSRSRKVDVSLPGK